MEIVMVDRIAAAADDPETRRSWFSHTALSLTQFLCDLTLSLSRNDGVLLFFYEWQATA